MYGTELTRDDRLRALALRMEVKRLEGGRTRPLSSPAHEALDAILAESPAWLTTQIHIEVAEQKTGWGIASPLRDAALAIDIDPVALVASGQSARDVLRARIDKIPNPEVLAGALTEYRKWKEQGLESESKDQRKNTRAHLKHLAYNHISIDRVITARISQRSTKRYGERQYPEFFKGMFDDDTRIVSNKMALRKLSKKECALIAVGMAYDWKMMSPGNYMRDHEPRASERRSFVENSNAMNRLVGIFDNGTLVGSITLSPIAEDEVELGWFVLTEHRKQGLATKAVGAVLDFIAERGSYKVHAQCLLANPAGLAVAENLGFEGDPEELRLGVEFDWTRLTRSVGPELNDNPTM